VTHFPDCNVKNIHSSIWDNRFVITNERESENSPLCRQCCAQANPDAEVGQDQEATSNTSEEFEESQGKIER
jgi:hypothetical protein